MCLGKHVPWQACASASMCLGKHVPWQACALASMCLGKHVPWQTCALASMCLGACTCCGGALTTYAGHQEAGRYSAVHSGVVASRRGGKHHDRTPTRHQPGPFKRGCGAHACMEAPVGPHILCEEATRKSAPSVVTSTAMLGTDWQQSSSTCMGRPSVRWQGGDACWGGYGKDPAE
jgi:hypothetical protein